MAKYEDLVGQEDWLIAFDARARRYDDQPVLTCGDVLVAGVSFARELGETEAPTAVERLTELGVRAVIAPSFGDQFHRSATLRGLPALAIEESGAIRSGDRLRIDVEARIISNKSSGDRYVIRNLGDDDILHLRTGGDPVGSGLPHQARLP